MNLLEKAKAYTNGARILSDWVGDGGIVAPKEQAQERAGTCLGCKHNQPGMKLAESVSAAIQEEVELKNAMELRVIGERSLHTCELCLCPLRLKVWTPLSYLTKYKKSEEIQKFPAHCWIRTESTV